MYSARGEQRCVLLSVLTVLVTCIPAFPAAVLSKVHRGQSIILSIGSCACFSFCALFIDNSTAALNIFYQFLLRVCSYAM